MANKRKISIRKVLQAMVTLVVTTACVTAILGASRMQRERIVKDIRIQIVSPSKQQFLDKQVLYKDLVTDLGIRPGKTTLAKLNVSAIEQKAYRNQWVGKAQIYLDNQSVLQMQLTPRRPAARIFYENGQSFYVDSTLRLLPLSDMNTYYTIAVTGMPVTGTDSMNKSLRAQTLKLVQFIERDTFWSAQIDQIAVTPDRKFELIPVLGTHKILLGDTSNLDKKFSTLFAFYRNVLNRIGWNKYETLDLRYNNQIVASPSLPWKMPNKDGLSNMDWLSSVMEEGRKDSLKLANAFIAPVAKVADTAKKHKPAVAATPASIPVIKKQVIEKKQVTEKKPVTEKKQATEKKHPEATAKLQPAKPKPKPEPKPAAAAASQPKQAASPPPKATASPPKAKKENTPSAPKYIFESNH